MKNNLRIFLVVGQLVATGYAGADSYAIFTWYQIEKEALKTRGIWMKTTGP